MSSVDIESEVKSDKINKIKTIDQAGDVIKPSQKKLMNKAKDIIADINSFIDMAIITNKKLDEHIVYNQLANNKINIKIVDQVYEQLKHQFKGYEQEKKSLERLDDIVVKKQFDSKENYEKYVTNIKSNIEYLLNATNQVGIYLGNKKALKKSERRGRKAKPRNPADQLTKLHFKVEDKEFKLISIDPSSIIGAQTLVIFNTKNRKLGIYCAIDDKGFEVKGTTLQNYDEKLSVQKIIRKPEMLPQFKEGNVRRVFVVFNENIRAKQQVLNGRLNQHIILLRAFKDKYPTE